MAHRSTIEFEVLSPDLVDEIQRVLPVLSAGGQVSVSLSSDLARVVAKVSQSCFGTRSGGFRAGRSRDHGSASGNSPQHCIGPIGRTTAFRTGNRAVRVFVVLA